MTAVGWLQPSGLLPHCLWQHQAQGPTAPVPPAQPALAERKGIDLVSLLPRPWGAFLSECIWALLVTQTHLVNKCFSWTFYTDAVWKWMTVSQILSLYFVASRSELLTCCAWLASWHYLRTVCWAAVKKWVPLACGYHIPDVCLPFWLEGGNLLVWFIVCLAPFLCRQGKICTSDLSAFTFYDELSLVKEKSKTVLTPGLHFA